MSSPLVSLYGDGLYFPETRTNSGFSLELYGQIPACCKQKVPATGIPGPGQLMHLMQGHLNPRPILFGTILRGGLDRIPSPSTGEGQGGGERRHGLSTVALMLL
jgi:hypothetical protein